MKPLLIFRHIDIEGPGYLAHFLKIHGIHYHLIRVDEGEEIPRSLDDVGGLVFMGGPMSVNDELPWIHQEITLIKRAADAKLPILGHCLGGQLISKALGGDIIANHVKEIGWHDVEWIENRYSASWLNGLPVHFEVFHWHGETFSIPHGATRILRSQHCMNQAFVMDNILALQFHVEMTAEMVQQWEQHYSEELATESNQSPAVQSGSRLLDDIESRVMALHRVANALYGHWLQTGINEQRPVL